MMRLFVGLPIPEDVRQGLAELQSGIPNVRWVPSENFHITLLFAGELDEATAEDLDDGLRQIRLPSFPLTVRGLGMFGDDHRAKTVWAGVDPSQPLDALQHRVSSVGRQIGLTIEHRHFHPHISLGRLLKTAVQPADRLFGMVGGNNLLSYSLSVDHFILYASHLGRANPIYEPLAEYPLGR